MPQRPIYESELSIDRFRHDPYAGPSMTKSVRVSQLAKELGMTSREVLEICIALGIGASSASSTIIEAQAHRVRRSAQEVRKPLSSEVEEPTTTSINYLLRLPSDLRKELENFKKKSGSKSLQSLMLQLLAEGLAKSGEIEAAELFARDLHVASLASAIGSRRGPTSTGQRPRSVQQIDLVELVETHHQVLRDLEKQKLTSYASLMDVALQSHRLLLDFVMQDSSRRDRAVLVRDFSNGLRSSAEQAMLRGKWVFAEALLLQACEIDPTNTDLGYQTGIYLLRRLVRRWVRSMELGKTTSGVTNKTLFTYVYSGLFDGSNLRLDPEEMENDATAWTTAKRAHELLHEAQTRPNHYDTHHWNDHPNRIMLDREKEGVWGDLATIIRCIASSDQKDLAYLRKHEDWLTKSLSDGFGYWERSFRMDRNTATLHREWAEWLEALEIFWWLGYRREVHALAIEARGFVSTTDAMERMSLLRGWIPDLETTENIALLVQVGMANKSGAKQYPKALYLRPMSV